MMEFGTYIKLDEIEPAQIWGINDDFFICHVMGAVNFKNKASYRNQHDSGILTNKSP